MSRPEPIQCLKCGTWNDGRDLRCDPCGELLFPAPPRPIDPPPKPPGPTIYFTAGARGMAVMDGPSWRCPACDEALPATDSGFPDSIDILIDGRGRPWHVACVGLALGQIARHDETRPNAHYWWEWPDAWDADFGDLLPNAMVPGKPTRRTP